MSAPKPESKHGEIPEPPETLDKELREKLKSLSKDIKDLRELVEKASKEIEEIRKKLTGASK